MRHSSIFIAVALVGCAQTSRDLAPRTPEQIDAEIEASTAKAENPPAEISVSRVYIDEKIIAACGLALPQAFFEFDSATLRDDDEHALRYVAECLDTGALKDTRIGIVGHADPRGSMEFNEDLGQERANAVADYLVKCGVERERLQSDSLGEEMASAEPDDWPANRRVDVILRSAPN